MKTQLPTLATLSLLLATSGCAANPAPHVGPTPSGHVLTANDIRISGGSSVLDGIHLLRRGLPMNGFAPSFRTRRGSAPVIYLDGIRIRDIGTLRTMSAGDVETMEYMDPPSATIRYGTGHVGGAIVIRTRKG